MHRAGVFEGWLLPSVSPLRDQTGASTVCRNCGLFTDKSPVSARVILFSGKSIKECIRVLFCRPWGVPASLSVLSVLVLAFAPAHAQQIAASNRLPDAPAPQSSSSAAQAPQQPSQKQDTSPNSPQKPAAPSSDEVLKREEKQRAFGVMPMFQSVGMAENVPPLRPKQKFQLMAKSSTDPFVIGLDGIIAGIGQARDTNSGTKTVTNADGSMSRVRYGFGQGAAGYFKRFGASYADTVDGNFWGNAVLPVLLKEDPRYFRMGSGSFVKRFSYSAETAVWCRRDNGKWGPNYANVAGNFISGGISNLYYPSEDSGFEKTAIGAMTVTAEGVIGSELIEFLPDIEHHFLKKKHSWSQ